MLDREWDGVLRSKGFYWLADKHDEVGEWAQAGGVLRTEGIGRWWDSVPQSQWLVDDGMREIYDTYFQEPFGDRRQEIVFIGIGMDRAAIVGALDACLLDDDEMLVGPGVWKRAMAA